MWLQILSSSSQLGHTYHAGAIKDVAKAAGGLVVNYQLDDNFAIVDIGRLVRLYQVGLLEQPGGHVGSLYTRPPHNSYTIVLTHNVCSGSSLALSSRCCNDSSYIVPMHKAIGNGSCTFSGYW